jgi:tetratricopeptide (TPR) repeat protein
MSLFGPGSDEAHEALPRTLWAEPLVSDTPLALAMQGHLEGSEEAVFFDVPDPQSPRGAPRRKYGAASGLGLGPVRDVRAYTRAEALPMSPPHGYFEHDVGPPAVHSQSAQSLPQYSTRISSGGSPLFGESVWTPALPGEDREVSHPAGSTSFDVVAHAPHYAVNPNGIWNSSADPAAPMSESPQLTPPGGASDFFSFSGIENRMSEVSLRSDTGSSSSSVVASSSLGSRMSVGEEPDTAWAPPGMVRCNSHSEGIVDPRIARDSDPVLEPQPFGSPLNPQAATWEPPSPGTDVNRVMEQRPLERRRRNTAPRPEPVSVSSWAGSEPQRIRGHVRSPSADRFKPGNPPDSPPRRTHSRSSSTSNSSSSVAIKSFLNQRRVAGNAGYESALAFTSQHIDSLPLDSRWKVFLELAATARKDGFHESAHQLFEAAALLQPDREQVWVEYSKAEDEMGNFELSRALLHEGLPRCTAPPQDLIKKAIRIEERRRNFGGVRALLARVEASASNSDTIVDVAKIIHEGAAFEGREGNFDAARQMYRFLVSQMQTRTPATQQLAAVFSEWAAFEEKWGHLGNAISVAKEGLQAYSKYSPLWFSLIKLQEKFAYHLARSGSSAVSSLVGDSGEELSSRTRVDSVDLSEVRATVREACTAVSFPMQFKIFFEAGRCEERAGNFEAARQCFVQSVYALTPSGGLNEGKTPAPLWKIWLGGARMELLAGQTDAALELLRQAKRAAPRNRTSAVLLECSRVHEYLNDLDKARRVIQKAARICKDWKVCLASVHLELRVGNVLGARELCEEALMDYPGAGRLWQVFISLHTSPDDQWLMFRRALQEVPKSGEVWCEAARVATMQRDWATARHYLEFAIHFTPQYGDIIIEFLRVELEAEQADEERDSAIALLERRCINADPNYGTLWLQCKTSPLDGPRQVFHSALIHLLQRDARVSLDPRAAFGVMDRWNLIFAADVIQT